ncbi:hypothetical protein CPB84DRAFT_1730415 [Gymnopilus junonius]|uniref:Uncharacterized protein n=1 Tax=Gymnopilus junonius TaxID=109634 RepID=A0A9P5NQI1_GYMJU|nr:hypothetical protein CPB84DRAFT_1730415 [Gymnopilus junonius]
MWANRSDVLQDMRVNVSEEGSPDVIWYKERYLGDNEIIENVVHNPTSTVLWTIHRPSSRGWYIRIRSPAFPPGVFIPLTPIPSTSPLHADAALSFNSRTNTAPALPTSDSNTPFSTSGSVSSVASSSSSGVHSYPPTPIATSPTSSFSKFSAGYFDGATPTQANFNSIKTHKRPIRGSLRPSSQITQFLLAPSSIPPSTHQPDPATMGFFAKALAVLKNNRPSHSNSFTLSRVLSASRSRGPTGAATPPPRYASNISQPIPELHTPLLVFHDRTPVYTVRSLTGLIELDKAEMTNLGVDASFWITVALTYLEFLEEREVSALPIDIINV